MWIKTKDQLPLLLTKVLSDWMELPEYPIIAIQE